MDTKEGPIINRVANSPIRTLDLEKFFPKEEFIEMDLKDFLFKGLILKEKDFRTDMKTFNWESLNNKILLILNSADAIVPAWAFALISVHASPFVHDLYLGNKSSYLDFYFKNLINHLDLEDFKDRPTVIKGCSDKPVPASAYAFATQRLLGISKSIMYGEPCSTVPLYKKPKQ